MYTGIYDFETQQTYKGTSFTGSDWAFSNVKNIPIESYNLMNGKRELTFTVVRGCPFNCSYCLAVTTFGRKERRKPVKEIVDYMERYQNDFDSFKLFAPTLT